MTEPGRPALRLDRLEAVVFDTDGVLTDTASMHAARGGQAAAPAEHGADLVVADLGALALQGSPVRRGAR